MTGVINIHIDGGSEPLWENSTESDKLRDLINKSDHNSLLNERASLQIGDETIEKMIKDIMPKGNDDSPVDPSVAPKTSTENQELVEISLDISKRDAHFNIEYQDPPFLDQKKKIIREEDNYPRRILIVDDDAYNAQFLAMELELVLEKLNLPVNLIEICHDGVSAVQMFEKSFAKM